MTYESITNRSLDEGFQEIFIYVNDITNGLFAQLFLFSIWIIAAVSLFMAKLKRTGDGDLPMCSAVASFITIVTAILLRLIPGMIDGLTLIVTILIGAICILWFLFSRK